MAFDRKAYMKEYHKKNYKRNKDKIDAKNKEYYDAHKDEIIEYKNNWYLEKKEKISTRNKRKWAKLTKEQRRELKLKEAYGLSLEEYNNILSSQNEMCAICGKKQGEERFPLHVDHDHQTGKIRGLLCQTCNQGLGLFKDNQELLIKAANYLDRQKEQE